MTGISVSQFTAIQGDSTMNLQIFYVLGMAGIATVLLYLVIGRVLPARWGKSEMEESEDFTIDSVNVLLGLLFSILLAFVIAGVLADYDNARSEAQREANALGAIYGFAKGIPEPAQSTWKRGSHDYTALVIEQDWPLMQQQQSSDAAWTAINALRDDVFAFQPANDRELSLQDKAIDKVQELYDTRRTRVDLVNAGVPDSLWYSLLGGAALSCSFRCSPSHTLPPAC